MKINKKSIIIITTFLVLGVISLVIKYFFAGTLYWGTYSNPEVNFSFKYPSSMRICEKDDSNSIAVIDNISHVVTESYGDFGTIQGKKYTKQKLSTPLTCDNYTMENSRYLVITDLNEETTETDIKIWIQNLSKVNPAKKDQLPVAGLTPIDGTAEWKFAKYVDNLLPNQQDNSVAEAIYFADDSTQYLIINNNRVYHLAFEPSEGSRVLPLKMILKTLKF